MEKWKTFLDNAGDLVESGVATESGEDAFLLESEEASGLGGPLDEVGIDVFNLSANEFLDLLGDQHLLHNDGAPLIAKGVVGGRDGPVEREVGKVEIPQGGGGGAIENSVNVVFGGLVGLIGLFAGGELAHEALSDKETDGAAENGIGTNQVDHAGEGRRSGVGVEGAEHEVAGNGGLDGGFGGVGIADFANHHDVGVEAQDGAKAVGEILTVGGVNGDLGNAGDAVLDGVFKSDNLAVSSVEGVEDGIESGGLTRASRADHEDEAAGVRNHLVDLGTLIGRETEEVEVEERFVEVEETENGVLAVHGGDGFDTDIEKMAGAVAVDVGLHVAGLRSLGCRRDTGAARKFAHEDAVFVAIEIGDGVENTVNTHTDADGITEILDVDVGSGEFVGLVEEEIEDLVGPDRVEGLGDGGNSFRVTLVGNLDVVVVDLLGRVVAEHKSAIGGEGDEEEIDVLASIGVFGAELLDGGARSLAGDEELVVLFPVALLERENELLVHLLNGEEAINQGHSVNEGADVEVGEPEELGTVLSGGFFVVATMLLALFFVH